MATQTFVFPPSDVVIANLLTLLEQSGDPSVVVNGGTVYTKDVGGVTQLFYEASDGTVTQLTPPAGGPHRLATNPDANHIIYWKLDEITGSTVFANSAATNPGQTLSLINGGSGDPFVGVTMPWRSRAVRGYGQNAQSWGYLESALAAPEPAFPITVEAWVLPQGDAYVVRILNKDQGGGVRAFDFFQAAQTPANSAVINFILGTTGGNYTQVTSNLPAGRHIGVDRWLASHIGVTYDGVTLKLYVNGTLTDSQLTPTAAIDYGAGTRKWAVLGDGSFDANNNYPGYMWDVALSNIARPLSYFEAVYAAGVGWA